MIRREEAERKEENSGNRAQKRMAPKAKWLVNTPQARKRTIAENLADKYLTRVSLYSFLIPAFEAAPKILYMFSQKLLDEIRGRLDNYRRSSEELLIIINVMMSQLENLVLMVRISSRINGYLIKSIRSVPLSRDSIPANLS